MSLISLAGDENEISLGKNISTLMEMEPTTLGDESDWNDGNISWSLQRNLTEWQRSELKRVSVKGMDCLLRSWLQILQHPISELYCNATWDEIYCWPATLAGENITRPCSEVMKDDPEITNAQEIVGDAIRICTENGSWEWNGWTNYNQCLEGMADYPPVIKSEAVDMLLVNVVRYMYFTGSVLSFVSLVVSLLIFYHFKSLRCDRIAVQIHLMVSLALRFLLMIIITEPFIFQRTVHYRNVDWVCKAVMALQLYATVASINWMFVQGHYLHSRLTTNVFDRGTPFKLYYFIGWVFPLLLVLSWAWVMETHHSVHCWTKYSTLNYIWIILGPIICAIAINFLYLVNIMRILLTKIQLATVSSDSTQFRRAVKATIVLFPLLGVTNLLFIKNPGGDFVAAYMITNTVLQSSQGILVATFYCFMSTEVKDAIRREYRRFTIKRSASTIRHGRSTRHRRRSSYWNQTQVTNSVYYDNPSTSTYQRRDSVSASTSFQRHASVLLSKIKPTNAIFKNSNSASPVHTNSNGGSHHSNSIGNGNGNGIHTLPTWTTGTSDTINNMSTTTTTPSPETINFLQSYVTVVYHCKQHPHQQPACSCQGEREGRDNGDGEPSTRGDEFKSDREYNKIPCVTISSATTNASTSASNGTGTIIGTDRIGSSVLPRPGNECGNEHSSVQIKISVSPYDQENQGNHFFPPSVV